MSAEEGLYDEALLLFFDEARDMRQQIEDGLMWLQQHPDDIDTVHALFRAAHTIKGTSGLFNLDRVVRFTHQVESVLDRVRKGVLALDAPLGEALLAGCDMLGTLLGQAEHPGQDAATTAAVDAAADALAARLAGFIGAGAAPLPSPADANADARVDANADPQADALIGCWHLSLRFGADTFRHGFDPLTIVQYLAGLGRIDAIAVVDELLPPWEAFDPESCFLGFEVRLDTTSQRQQIEEAFEFVGPLCAVRMIAPTRRAADFIDLLRALPHEQRLGELLVACGAVTRTALDAALGPMLEPMPEPMPMPEPTPASGAAPGAQPPVHSRASAPNPAALPAPAGVLESVPDNPARVLATRQDGGLFVRVPADKLDDLINLVGELVICGASAAMQAQATANPALIGTTQQLSRLVEEIRGGALGLRMVRIGETFVRYRRVVHDVAQELGKLVALDIEGADTELDKSVVEKIGDPLMHLVRNALDHGIEAPAVRTAAGKPAQGTISLSARHDSGNIVIVVSDDGRGLDGDMLLAKARERGLVAPGQVLSEAEKLDLIFLAGFSTAAQVTNLSGRGVGMDVVRKNIEALRGSVRLESQVGRYTEVEIRLPLTLAIIDGFLVRVGASAFVVPLHAVHECIDADPDGLNLNDKAAGYIKLRGAVLPLLDLRRVFGSTAPAPARRRIVMVQGVNGKAGLIVDRLDGEYQTVIKPLGKLFRQLRGISGSTVLGSGEVALILDVPALVKLATEPHQATPGRAPGTREQALRRQLQAACAGQNIYQGEA